MTGECMLSVVHPESRPELLASSKFCDVYSRTYLDKYVQSPGQVVKALSDVQVGSVSSANLCAQQCTQSQNVSCRSFEYCGSNKECLLYKSHRLDFAASKFVPNQWCSFYSRNYLDDFQKISRSTLSFSQTLDYTGVSVDQCAKLCVDAQGINCRSFAFCGNSSFCRLTESHPKQKGILVARDYCDLYARQYSLDGSKYNPTTATTATQQKNTAPKKKTYTAGAMAGIALGLFIPGLAFGAALFHFISLKFKNANQHT